MSSQPKQQKAAAPKAAAKAAPAAAKPAAAAAPAKAAAPAAAAAKPAAAAAAPVKKAAAAVEEKKHTGGVYDSYEGEPAGAARKPQPKAKAAAPAAAASAAAPAVAEKPVAFQFTVANNSVEGKTNPQLKAALNTAFFGWGVIDEIRIVSKEESKEITAFFTRPLGKGLEARSKIEKGEAATFAFPAGKEQTLSIFEGAASGGGRASKTAANAPKKPEGGRGGRGGRGGASGGRGGASGGSGCFECGQDGHRAFECPNKGGEAAGAGRGGRGGARGGRGGAAASE